MMISNDIGHANMFMQVYPSYQVTWWIEEHHVNQTMRMSQDDLEAFIRILRFNNVEEFHVKRESLAL